MMGAGGGNFLDDSYYRSECVSRSLTATLGGRGREEHSAFVFITFASFWAAGWAVQIEHIPQKNDVWPGIRLNTSAEISAELQN